MFKPGYFCFLYQGLFVKQYTTALWFTGKCSCRHTHFYVKHCQNVNFSLVKLTSNTKNNSFALSSPAIKLKMLGLIVSINWQSVRQIATYAGILLVIFKSVSLQPTMVAPCIECWKSWQLCENQKLIQNMSPYFFMVKQFHFNCT